MGAAGCHRAETKTEARRQGRPRACCAGRSRPSRRLELLELLEFLELPILLFSEFFLQLIPVLESQLFVEQSLFWPQLQFGRTEWGQALVAGLAPIGSGLSP